jgi:hypothetical protein
MKLILKELVHSPLERTLDLGASHVCIEGFDLRPYSIHVLIIVDITLFILRANLIVRSERYDLKAAASRQALNEEL